jgi:hypothetical protein
MVGGAIADSAPTPEPCVAGPIDGAIHRRPSSPLCGRLGFMARCWLVMREPLCRQARLLHAQQRLNLATARPRICAAGENQAVRRPFLASISLSPTQEEKENDRVGISHIPDQV